MELCIAHLSDIHFKDNSDFIGYDANESMREDIVRDLIVHTAEYGALDAIIVSGDIAYSGKEAEFSLARSWLYSVMERTNSPKAKIIVCPGNHDIDRDIFKEQKFILDIHDAIRSPKNVEGIQNALFSRINDDAGKATMMKSLEGYNNFAVEYKCDFYPSKQRYSWFHDLELNDGSFLRVRGLNTTILCGKSDSKKSLFLGRNAWNLPKEDGVEYLVFAHHPPSWLFDENEMKNELDDKAKIQMYGHEHTSKIEPGVNSVRLFAGATNPDRDQPGWKPGFNFLRVNVQTTDKKRKLTVVIHSREWQEKAPSQFNAYRGKEFDGTHKYEFPLSPWNKPNNHNLASDHINASSSAPHASVEIRKTDELMQTAELRMTEQEFLRRLFNLSFAQQKTIFDELGVSEPDEAALPHFVQIKNSIKRAKERGLLKNISDKI